MNKTDPRYIAYTAILREELIPATGCTEPIALAYAAALLRDLLGGMPEACTAHVSGNIIKNVKSVVVPNTGGRRGIECALAAGFAAGRADDVLNVLSHVHADDVPRIDAYLSDKPITVRRAEDERPFYLRLEGTRGTDAATVEIAGHHTNVTLLQKNGVPVFEGGASAQPEQTDRSLLNVRDIVDFADSLDVSDVAEVIGRQIEYNGAISAEGLENAYGAQIGRILLRGAGEGDWVNRCKAAAAAGSDARMSGCELPVIILSGSGNQGITASMPVIEYARAIGAPREKLIRALVLSDLLTVHQKTGIGCLSAFCGAVSAGGGAAAGIAYLCGGGYDEIAHTLVNTLAITSGMVCDGAKPSCAAKIAMAVEAGLLGYRMYQNGQQFYGGDGIIVKGVDNTIENIGRVAREGMRETDREIIELMIQERQAD